jgi:hypothetical protein
LKVIFDYLSIYSDIIPAIIFLFAFTKHKDKGLWVLFFLNFYSFANNLVLINEWYRGLNFNFYILYRLYTVAGYTLIALFFYLNIISRITKKVIIVTFALFIIYAIYDFIISPLESFDSIPSAFEAILIIIFAIFYLFEQMKNPRVFFIYTLDKFWIVASLLIYYTGTFFLFIYAESYIADPSFNENYSLINNVFLLIKNIVFSIGLFVINKPSGYSSNSYPDFDNILENRY